MDPDDLKLLESYKKQRLKAEKNGQLENEANLSHYIGYLHEKNGNFEEAVVEHKRAIRILEGLSKKIDTAVGYRTLGECYCKQKEYKKALHLHEKYFLLARECNDLVEQQRALTTIGNTYLEQSSDRNLSIKTRQSVSKKAEETYLKSLQICDKIKGTIDEKEYVDMRARNFYNLGLVYEGLEDTSKSKDYLKKAVSLCQSHSLHEVLFICQKALGEICIKEEDLDHASTFINSALDTVKKLKNKHLEIECLLAKAQLLVLLKDFLGSKHQVKKAHKMCLKNEDEKIKIYETYKAVKCMEKTTKTLQKSEDMPEKIKCYDKLGDCAVDLKLFPLAIKFYSKELSTSLQTKPDKKDLVPIYISLAQTCCDCGLYEKGIGYFKKEIECYGDNEFEQVCRSWLNIATYEEKCDKSYNHVKLSYVNAHNYAKKAGNRKLQCRALYCLIELFKLHKDEKLLKKTQEQLDHIKQKYGVPDIEVEEESQNIDDDNNGDDDDGIVLPAVDDVEMSDLTESEDDEMVVKTVRMVNRQGRRQKELKRNDFGETPLHRACIKGDLKQVKKLIEDGHPVNVQDHSGWIPLHEAANNNWYDVTEYLLQHGADINHRGGEKCGGMTPLIDAASVGWLDIVELLLKYGAKAWAKDDHQMTALDYLIKLKEDVGTLDRETEIKYNNIVGKLKEKNPAYRGVSRNKLLSQLKTSALVPESDPASGTQPSSSSTRVNKIANHSRNSFIDDTDSESEDLTSGTSQNRTNQDNSEDTPRDDDSENYYTMDIDSLDSVDINDETATDAYKSAISNIGRSAKQISQSSKLDKSKRTQKSKASALIAEEEFIENDWLVNDVKTVKPKKVDVNGYLSTGQIRKRSRSGSISPDPRFDRRNSDFSNRKKRLKIVESDSDTIDDDDDDVGNGDNDNEHEVITTANPTCDTYISDDEMIHNDKIDRSDDEITVVDVNMNDHDHDDDNDDDIDILDMYQDVNFTPQSVPAPSQRQKKKSQKQLKLTDFAGPKINSSQLNTKSDQNSTTGSIGTSSAIPASQSVRLATEISKSSVIKVKVNVEGVLLLIPVIDQDGDKTFEWLADEAARRYYKMKGVKLKLTLGKDGAHFSPEDLVSLMLADNDLVESFVDSKDEQPPMVDTYKMACQNSKTVCYKNICTLLQACEVSGKLNLVDLVLKSQRFQPVLKSIQHQTCLRELNIRGNRIGDTGLENLCKVLNTLPNITLLCIGCNDITTQGLKCLVTSVSDENKKSLQSLTTLDISYNPLYDDCLSTLASLVKGLPKLTRLNMSSCQISTKFFHSERLPLQVSLQGSIIQHIDVSFNHLETVGVELFLKCQNPTKIVSLDLSGTISATRSSQFYRHLYSYCSQDFCTLQQLILRQCHLCEQDVDFLARLPAVCRNLQKLDISGNSRLSNYVLQQIFQSSACESSNLDEITANQCGFQSPLSSDLLDSLSEKLAARTPLRNVEFTCFKLEKLDVDSLNQIWTDKYRELAHVVGNENSIKLTVAD